MKLCLQSPMMKAGQVFYADYAKSDGLGDEAWKAIFNTFLRLPTEQTTTCFTINPKSIINLSRDYAATSRSRYFFVRKRILIVW